MFRILVSLLFTIFVSTNAFGSIPKASDCDSLVLSNGTVYAVKNVVTSAENVSFSYCNDASGAVHTVPWMQVNRIKKADGSELVSPAFKPAKPAEPEPVLTAAEQALEDQVEAVFKMSRIAVPAILLFGAGLVLAVIVLDRRKRLLKAIAGHPNEAKLKNLLKRARRNAWLILFIFAAAAIALISFVAYLDYLARHV